MTGSEQPTEIRAAEPGARDSESAAVSAMGHSVQSSGYQQAAPESQPPISAAAASSSRPAIRRRPGQTSTGEPSTGQTSAGE